MASSNLPPITESEPDDSKTKAHWDKVKSVSKANFLMYSLVGGKGGGKSLYLQDNKSAFGSKRGSSPKSRKN